MLPPPVSWSALVCTKFCSLSVPSASVHLRVVLRLNSFVLCLASSFEAEMRYKSSPIKTYSDVA